MFLVFSSFLLIGIDKPIASTECEDGQYWSSIQYDCVTCPENTTATDFGCYFDNLINVSDTTSNVTRQTCINNGYIPIGEYCYNISEIEAYAPTGSMWSSFVGTGISEKDRLRAKILYTCAMIDSYNDSCSQFLANMCVNGHYNTVPWCVLYNEKFPIVNQQVGDYFGYKYWPINNVLFLKYAQNTGLDNIMKESMFNSNFYSNEKVNIYVARFSQWGEFLGFKVIEDDLQFCKESIEVVDEWMKFGHNYLSTCLNNLKEFLDSRTTEFYDLFIQDGVDDTGFPILRPIPVVDRLYQNNIRQNDLSDIEPGRRFFTFSNWSGTTGSDGNYQYASNIKFYFEIQESNKDTIKVPYLDISYNSVQPSVVENSDNSYVVDPKVNDANPAFSFRTQYTMNEDKFWRGITIAFVVILILALVFWGMCTFVYGSSNGKDGISGKIICHCVSVGFDIFGSALYLLVWVIAFFIWCFFKLQKSTHTTLEDESAYHQAEVIVWVAFAFKAIASLLSIYDQSNFDIYLIDWEQQRADNVPVSTWRRIMIANEWNRILTIRSYNLPFTLVAMVFLLNGFDWWLLSSPIPSTDRIDVGMHYQILTIALSSSLFIVIVFLQYIWNYWINWRFFGTPFLNFIDLCSNANISVLLRQSGNHGHYIHGRSLHSHSDETMAKLNENLEYEANGLVGTRGLLTNTNEQVFETFLSPNVRKKINELASQMTANSGGLHVNAKNFQPQNVHAAQETNDYLKKFFDGSSSENKFQVLTMSFLQSVTGYNTLAEEPTTLFIEDEKSYTDMLLLGIEWRLALFYLIMFVGIEMETNSPGIAAFCVYLTDFAFVWLYEHLSKRNLAIKSLLDERFLL